MTTNPIFSYTKRDYESSRKEGIAKIPILSKGNWTDLNATDPGIIILDYVHALVDMVNYYQDHQALETFMSTAKERTNIFRLAKQLSYQVRSAKGAICDVTFTSHLTYDHPIRIPKYTAVSTASDIQYVTTTDAYLPTRATTVTVKCEQGDVVERIYTGTGISRFSSIVSASNQVVTLSSPNIDIDTISIKDNLGRTWTPVDYIVFSSLNERVYQIELNPDSTVSIKFGDGERGAIPGVTDVLTIQYISTLAEGGKIAANSIISLDDIITDNGLNIEFSVSNTQASSGGAGAQSSSEIRELAPGAIKSQYRAVTLKDFENLAKLVDGVAEAKAYDINIKPELCLHHEVKVMIIPEDPQGSLSALRDTVYAYLSKRMIPPTSLQVITPTSTNINIAITVKKVDTEVSDAVEYSVRESVIEYFNNRTVEVGEMFYPADLSAVISNIPTVRYVTSITPASPVTIQDLSIASLGTLNITII